jgi:riboflavin kinase/FMN adenylyltransferase
MKVLKSLSDLDRIKKGCVLTIGNFDGLHVGHQAILTTARKAASQRKTELVVMTFDPHPAAVLYPQRGPAVLTPLPLKKHLLAQLAVDYLFIVKTTRRLLDLSPPDFVHKFLVEHIQPGAVVEGESFNFGLGRSGTVRTLKELGKTDGFKVIIVEAEKIKLSTGEVLKVSSSAIRKLLAGGDVADAAVALGRHYRLIEKIVPGRGKGRKLGFPTANMKSPRQLLPAEGVYAGFVEVADTLNELLLSGQKIPAAFSIGRHGLRGDGSSFLIEAHLLVDSVGRLYNKWLAMDFVTCLRSRKKFKTDKALAAQIAKDCKEARKILSGDRM